jgi:hypothetical protein
VLGISACEIFHKQPLSIEVQASFARVEIKKLAALFGLPRQGKASLQALPSHRIEWVPWPSL